MASRPTSVSSPALRGILFDATGTLIETREGVGDVYSRLAARHGVDLPGWRLEDAFRRVLRHAPPRAYPDADPAEIEGLERRWWWEVVRSTILAGDSTARFDDFDAFFAELFGFYATGDAWRLRPGARSSLSTASRLGLRSGLVSNFDQRLLEILEALDIAHFFEVVVIPADARAEKPAARVFETALGRLELAAQATLFVGDDAENDLEAARALGFVVFDASTPEALERLPAFLDEYAAPI